MSHFAGVQHAALENRLAEHSATGLASGLTAFSMALGVMLVVAVLLIHGVIAESFRNNSSLGYNLIRRSQGRAAAVGAQHGLLSERTGRKHSVHVLPGVPRCRGARRRIRTVAGRTTWNVWSRFAWATTYQKYRVVGTTPEDVRQLRLQRGHEEKYEFAEGRNFQHFSEEYGFFEAVIGAKVARENAV